MIDAVQREQPLPAGLLRLVRLAIDDQYNYTRKTSPALRILDDFSEDRETLLVLRQVCKAFKQWVSPLSPFLFQKITFVYPALVRQKRRKNLQKNNLGVLYGQVLEKSSLDALLRIEPFVTHVRLEIAPTGSSNLDPGSQLLDSLLRSSAVEKISIRLLPNDKCLPSSLDSIAPRAVSNHLWTLPYFSAYDDHALAAPSNTFSEIGYKKDTPRETEDVSHALPLRNLRASLERCRPHMYALRSIHFENLSIQGINTLSESSDTDKDRPQKNKRSLWSTSLSLSISMIKWWTLPAEHWPFFEGKGGALPTPGTDHPVTQRSREANLKLRGWQVFTRWLRSIQSEVQSLDFAWVEPRVILPPSRGAASPSPEPSISSPTSPSMSDVKDFPLRPLSLYQTLEHEKTIVLSYSKSSTKERKLNEKSSHPEMSNRAAIEEYAAPPVSQTPRLAWRVTDGPIPLFNELRELETSLTWPVLTTLSLRKIHVGAADVKNLLDSAPSLRNLSVSPDYIEDTELPLLNASPTLSYGSSGLDDIENPYFLPKPSLCKFALISAPSPTNTSLPTYANDTFLKTKLKTIDLPLFLLQQCPRKHKLRKRLSNGKSHNPVLSPESPGQSESTKTSTDIAIVPRSTISSSESRTLSFKGHKLGSAISNAMTSTASTTCFGTGTSLADFGTRGLASASTTTSTSTSALTTQSSRTETETEVETPCTEAQTEGGLASILEGKEGFTVSRSQSKGKLGLGFGVPVSFESPSAPSSIISSSVTTGYSVSISGGSSETAKKESRWKRLLGLNKKVRERNGEGTLKKEKPEGERRPSDRAKEYRRFQTREIDLDGVEKGVSVGGWRN